jgi:hypothetical protein
VFVKEGEKILASTRCIKAFDIATKKICRWVLMSGGRRGVQRNPKLGACEEKSLRRRSSQRAEHLSERVDLTLLHWGAGKSRTTRGLGKIGCTGGCILSSVNQSPLGTAMSSGSRRSLADSIKWGCKRSLALSIFCALASRRCTEDITLWSGMALSRKLGEFPRHTVHN